MPDILKVKSTHEESQGPFVLIDKHDFDPKVHELYEPKAEKSDKKPKAEKEQK